MILVCDVQIQLKQLLRGFIKKLSKKYGDVDDAVTCGFDFCQYKQKLYQYVLKWKTKLSETDGNIEYKKVFKLARNWFDQSKYKCVGVSFWVTFLKKLYQVM